jgi:DNA polymerase I
LINDDLKERKHEPRPYHYWICKHERGIFAEVMRKLFEKKMEYKRLGMKLEEKAIKLLANSGYGTFGQPRFKYYDFRVAELITAFSRHTLLELKKFLQEKGLEVIYGDTDSLFVKNDIMNDFDITSEAKSKFQVEFIRDKSWKVLVLLSKKEYFGILENGEHISKTIYGLRDDKPPYFNTVTFHIISKETLEQDLNPESLKEHALQYIQSVFNVLSDKIILRDEVFIREQLPWRGKNSKSLSQYRSGWQKHVFEEKLAESNDNLVTVELDNPAGSIQPHWKIIPDGDGDKNVTIYPERYALDLHQYKEDLWTCFEPILEAYGFTRDELIRLRSKLVDNQREV